MPFIYFSCMYYAGMRLGFGQNSGKFYGTIDSNPIQQHWRIEGGGQGGLGPPP